MGVQTRLHIKQAGRAAVCRATLSRVLRPFDRGTRCQRERSQHATVEETLGRAAFSVRAWPRQSLSSTSRLRAASWNLWRHHFRDESDQNHNIYCNKFDLALMNYRNWMKVTQQPDFWIHLLLISRFSFS